ncbi:sulfate adenylyltransferase [Sulfobacillus acidophilus TPY]|uniref:Sulfate adenylyltransferase n=1 Tax=Sulfobacillus acidophilus (strain ATCC 700253 / DSM 10332 / NAL) TaxID=679936 RepID=G8TZN2_SULAD|nr:sulfate adenylyltransferase [Sulfobacillus acidophilus TPY]AEW06362.1 sulfate adenylyltransferase [Sulfobacillus acidophilus DSM 10332]
MRVTSIAEQTTRTLSEPMLPPAIARELAFTLSHAPTVELSAFAFYDAWCLSTGVYTPLNGFMTKEETQAVLDSWRLPDGSVWPLPVTLPIEPEDAARVQKSPWIRLTVQGRIVGIMQVTDVFWQDPEEEALAVYGTYDEKHPGVFRTLASSPVRAAGPVVLFQAPPFAFTPTWTPRQMQQEIRRRHWQTVAAFQTRNPLHRGHEYLHKVTLEWVDGLVIHPLVGETKADDIPAHIRGLVYETLLTHYYPKDRVLLSGFPASMRYAGPREAVFHAVTRKNYGFTHFIVGRDHAGVGDFYDPRASQSVFDQFSPEEIGIRIISAEPAYYCRACGQMATRRTCPHGPTDHESPSGTRVRRALSQNQAVPDTILRPEVADILRAYYRTQA